MSHVEAVLHHLRNTAAVMSAVPGEFWDSQVPHEHTTRPAVVYQVAGTARGHSHSGAEPETDEVYLMTAWASRPGEARAAAEAVITAVDGVSGEWGPADGRISVQRCFADGGRSRYDQETKVHGWEFQIRVWARPL